MAQSIKMKTKTHPEMDLTNGNLFLKIPLFALPMALSTILQLLYSTVDLFTVSHYGGGNLSMSAVGSNSALVNLIITLFVSLAVGANVALGNAKGADNKEKAQLHGGESAPSCQTLTCPMRSKM